MNMIAKNKAIAFSLILIMTTLLLTGCSDEINFYVGMNNGIEHGFEYSNYSGAESYTLFSAYKSDKRVFDLDNVTVNFYYGGYYQDVNNSLKSYNFPNFKIAITDEERLKNNEYAYVRIVEENYVSEKYNCELIWRKNKKTEIKFNYSESIRIPKELFDKKCGHIVFLILGKNLALNDPAENIITRTGFYYKIINDKVILSSKESSIEFK